MNLRSQRFRDDPKLAAAAVLDSAHIAPGAAGQHVAKIQQALIELDGIAINSSELQAARYGASTANAVLAYKKKRNIINRAYQTQADNIVGKMTMAALDNEIVAKESKPANLLLNFGVTPPSVRDVAISVANGLADRWAAQYVRRQPQRRAAVLMPAASSAAQAVALIKTAIVKAGPGGMVIFNVGHGGVSSSGNSLDGTCELAPNGALTLGGANVSNVFANVFYDTNLAGPNGHSEEQNDLTINKGTAGAKQRQAHWALYQDLALTFRRTGTRWVVLLTCNVGNAPDFLKKIAQDWNVIVGAYTRQVALQQQPNGRARIFLVGDAPGGGTNQPVGEEELPTSASSIRVGPPLPLTP